MDEMSLQKNWEFNNLLKVTKSVLHFFELAKQKEEQGAFLTSDEKNLFLTVLEVEQEIYDRFMRQDMLLSLRDYVILLSTYDVEENDCCVRILDKVDLLIDENLEVEFEDVESNAFVFAPFESIGLVIPAADYVTGSSLQQYYDIDGVLHTLEDFINEVIHYLPEESVDYLDLYHSRLKIKAIESEVQSNIQSILESDDIDLEDYVSSILEEDFKVQDYFIYNKILFDSSHYPLSLEDRAKLVDEKYLTIFSSPTIEEMFIKGELKNEAVLPLPKRFFLYQILPGVYPPDIYHKMIQLLESRICSEIRYCCDALKLMDQSHYEKSFERYIVMERLAMLKFYLTKEKSSELESDLQKSYYLH